MTGWARWSSWARRPVMVLSSKASSTTKVITTLPATPLTTVPFSSRAQCRAPVLRREPLARRLGEQVQEPAPHDHDYGRDRPVALVSIRERGRKPPALLTPDRQDCLSCRITGCLSCIAESPSPSSRCKLAGTFL